MLSYWGKVHRVSSQKYQIILFLSGGTAFRELKEYFDDDLSFVHRLDQIHHAMKHHGCIHFDGHTISTSFPFMMSSKNLVGPTKAGLGHKTAIWESYDWIFNQGKDPR